MQWKISSNKIMLNDHGKNESVPAIAIWKAEFSNERTYKDSVLTRPSDDLPHLNFDRAHYCSSLRIKVIVPSDNAKNKKAVLCLCCIDPDFQIYELNTVPMDQVIIDNRWLMLDPEEASNISEVLIGLPIGTVPFKDLARLYKLGSPLVEFIVDDLRCQSVESPVIHPDGLMLHLYPYQQTGVNWLSSIVAEGVGCVLADEMGLGKTFQVIALLLAQKSYGTSLVVAPNSLLENWKREIEKFAPSLNSFINHGPNRINYWKHFLDYDVIISSYDTVVSDCYSLFTQLEWNIVILDEAQAIKNHGTKRSTYLRDIPKRSGVAVSGTPFENHVTDIWSIFDFVYKGLLGEIDAFKAMFSDNTQSAENLEKIISPLLLRRKVDEVKDDLPEKIIIPEALVMNIREAAEYEQFRQTLLRDNGSQPMGAITKLRQFCAHPSLILESPIWDDHSEVESMKFQRLLELLDEFYATREKVIVFTGWIKAQGIISESISRRYCAYAGILNGSVPVDERQGLVDEFSKQDGFAVLILNPDVGGTGLNITAANHVIHYSLEWNPAKEDQASARAYRIGQQRPVTIHRLYYLRTVEEMINERIEKKRAISSILIQGTDGEEEADIRKALRMSPMMTSYKE